MAVEPKKEETKKVLPSKVVVLVDTKDEDVLKWNEEGRKLFFDDEEGNFRELAPEVVKSLSLSNRERYDVAKNIVSGADVIGNVQDSIQGFSARDYNIRPGSASANLAVYGKKPGEDYYWERAENVDKRRAESWKVDKDPDVHTRHQESCSYKTVGGQAKPELVLLSRPKSVSAEEKARKQKRRDALVGKATDSYRDAVERIGAIATTK